MTAIGDRIKADLATLRDRPETRRGPFVIHDEDLPMTTPEERLTQTSNPAGVIAKLLAQAKDQNRQMLSLQDENAKLRAALMAIRGWREIGSADTPREKLTVIETIVDEALK